MPSPTTTTTPGPASPGPRSGTSAPSASPAQLPGARFTIRFRQQPVVIHMTQREVTVAAGEGMWHDVPMIIAGREHTLSPGEKLTVPLD